MKRSTGITLSAAALFGIVIASQACSSSPESISPTTKQAKSTNMSSGGNGEYYGGKLQAGRYLRTLPANACPSGTNIGVIEVKATGEINGSFTDPRTCLQTAMPIDYAELEYANYAVGRVGFSEGIYSFQTPSTGSSNSGSGSSNSGSSSNPRLTVDESWCRTENSTKSQGFDVVLKANYARREFGATIVELTRDTSGTESKMQFAADDLERDIDMGERIRYRGTTFRMDIDATTYDRSTGKMIGRLRYTREGLFIEDRTLVCRVGGELDIAYIARPYNIAKYRDPLQAIRDLASAFTTEFRITP